jgi:hypothetical protein
VWYHEEPGEEAVVAGEVEGEEEARDAAEGQELHEGAHAQLGQHERGEGRAGAHAVDERGRAAAGDGAEAELVLQEERRESGEGRQDRRHAEEHARHQPVDQGQALQVLAHRPGREHPRIEQERHRRRGVGCCCCLRRRWCWWWPHGEGRRGRSVGAAEAVAESADERWYRPTGCRGVDGGSDDASAALAPDASAAFDGDVVPLLAAFARDDLRAALDTEVAPVLHIAHGGQRRAGGRRRQRKLRRRCVSGRRLRRGCMAVGVGGLVQVEMMPTGVQGVVAVERAEVGGVVGEVRVVDHVMTAAAAAAHASATATSAAEEGVVSVGGRDVVVVGNRGVMAVGKETTAAEAGVTVGGRQGQVAASRERRVGEVRLLGRGRG